MSQNGEFTPGDFDAPSFTEQAEQIRRYMTLQSYPLLAEIQDLKSILESLGIATIDQVNALDDSHIINRFIRRFEQESCIEGAKVCVSAPWMQFSSYEEDEDGNATLCVEFTSAIINGTVEGLLIEAVDSESGAHISTLTFGLAIDGMLKTHYGDVLGAFLYRSKIVK